MSLESLGFATTRKDGITLIYKPSFSPHVRPACSRSPMGIASALKGRTELRIVEPDMVARSVMHGGMFRHITGRRFLTPGRTMREIEISAYLSSRGIPTPEIIAVRLIRNGVFHEIDVVTRLVPGSMDLLSYLETPRPDGIELMNKAGSLIRRVHELGVYHADLHVKNLLVDSAKDLWMLDLDKAYRFGDMPRILKQYNLRRFTGSVRKWLAKGRILVEPGWEAALRDGYG